MITSGYTKGFNRSSKYRVIYRDENLYVNSFEVISPNFHSALSDFEAMNIYKEILSITKL